MNVAVSHLGAPSLAITRSATRTASGSGSGSPITPELEPRDSSTGSTSHSSGSNSAGSSSTAMVNIPKILNWLPVGNVIFSLDEHFRRLSTLGSGVSSTVYKVKGLHGALRGRKLAMKVIPKDAKYAAQSVDDEARALGQLRHPGIIAFKGCYVDAGNYAILTELGAYDLFDIVFNKKGERCSERRVRRVCKELLRTLVWLHAQRIAHRDIKLENIVFLPGDKNCSQPKLIDFADSLPIRRTRAKVKHLMGTVQYMSPQKFRVHEAWEALAGDVWSVGVVAFEMLTGTRMFAGSKSQARRKVIDNDWHWPHNPKRVLSEPARLFVEELCTWDASKRPSALECLQHPFLHPEMNRRTVQNTLSAPLHAPAHVRSSTVVNPAFMRPTIVWDNC